MYSEKICPRFHMAASDSNKSSLSGESEALPVSHCTPGPHIPYPPVMPPILLYKPCNLCHCSCQLVAHLWKSLPSPAVLSEWPWIQVNIWPSHVAWMISCQHLKHLSFPDPHISCIPSLWMGRYHSCCPLILLKI